MNFKKQKNKTKAKSWTIICHFESFIYWHSQSLSHLNISEDGWMATVLIWLPFSICHWTVSSSKYDYFKYASHDKERNKNNRNSSEFSKLCTETINLFQGHMHIFLIFYCLYYKKLSNLLEKHFQTPGKEIRTTVWKEENLHYLEISLSMEGMIINLIQSIESLSICTFTKLSNHFWEP